METTEDVPSLDEAAPSLSMMPGLLQKIIPTSWHDKPGWALFQPHSWTFPVHTFTATISGYFSFPHMVPSAVLTFPLLLPAGPLPVFPSAFLLACLFQGHFGGLACCADSIPWHKKHFPSCLPSPLDCTSLDSRDWLDSLYSST